jgi:predicted amidohydrolase YtcJ
MAGAKADKVLTGGRIFLGLAEGFAEALAIRGGRVVAQGTASDLEGLIGPQTELLRLDGRAVVPGFNDGHQHMLLYGLELGEVNLHPSRLGTLTELQRAIAQRAAEMPPGSWILGRRYDHFHLDTGRHPTREDLDAAAPDHPVYVTRTCGHVGVANSRALALAGIDAETADPPGGEIERTGGRPTGVLFENAQQLVKAVLPPLDRSRLIAALEAAGAAFIAQGITSVTDAGLGLRQKFDDYRAYRAAYEAKRLPLRVYLAFTGGPNGIEEEAAAAGLMTGQGDERLKIGPIKLFADGSAGGKTAAMTLPYICACQNRGLFVYQDQELDDWVARYHAADYQVAIHAIGDAAIEQALNAVERAQQSHPAEGRRHRIEHCGFTHDYQIQRMARLGMVPAPQPIFLYEFGELYIDVLGEERPATAYPMRSWMNACLLPIASSDTPVSDFSPMKNLYAMVTRRTHEGRVLGIQEALTLEEAVSALTLNGAYGSFSEQEKGTLAPGRLADLAVLDRDIFAGPPEGLLEAQVDMTLLEGESVFTRQP